MYRNSAQGGKYGLQTANVQLFNARGNRAEGAGSRAFSIGGGTSAATLIGNVAVGSLNGFVSNSAGGSNVVYRNNLVSTIKEICISKNSSAEIDENNMLFLCGTTVQSPGMSGMPGTGSVVYSN